MKKLNLFSLLIVAVFLVSVLGGINWFSSRSTVESQSDPIRDQIFWETFDIASTSFLVCDTGDVEAAQVCTTGSAAEDGWIIVSDQRPRSVQFEVITFNATSLDVILEGRLRGATDAAQIWPATGDLALTAVGTVLVEVPDSIYQIRAAVKIDTDTGANSVSATLNTFEAR